MKMSEKLCERYISALEKEARRNELYTQLLTAQLAQRAGAELIAELQAAQLALRAGAELIAELQEQIDENELYFTR